MRRVNVEEGGRRWDTAARVTASAPSRSRRGKRTAEKPSSWQASGWSGIPHRGARCGRRAVRPQPVMPSAVSGGRQSGKHYPGVRGEHAAQRPADHGRVEDVDD